MVTHPTYANLCRCVCASVRQAYIGLAFLALGEAGFDESGRETLPLFLEESTNGRILNR